MQNKIDALVGKFVEDMGGLVRETVLDEVRTRVREAIGGVVTPTRGVRRRSSPLTRDALSGAKRTPQLINDASARIIAALKKRPGSSCEELQKATGLSSALITLPLRRLVEAKDVTHKGVARGRKYWVKA